MKFPSRKNNQVFLALRVKASFASIGPLIFSLFDRLHTRPFIYLVKCILVIKTLGSGSFITEQSETD